MTDDELSAFWYETQPWGSMDDALPVLRAMWLRWPDRRDTIEWLAAWLAVEEK